MGNGMPQATVDPGGLAVAATFLCDELGAALAQCLAEDASRARLSLAYRLYYKIRPWVPLGVRRQLQRGLPTPGGDDWFIPTQAFDRIREAVGTAERVRLIHPWPDACDWSFVPTHDVETSDGLRNALAIAEIEQELGFRSAWNLVPYAYRVDHGIVNELCARGFEVAIHGYNHDGRLYESRDTFFFRAEAINEALAKYQAVGFRSPMVHRNLEWLQELEIEYDASYFDVDPYQAMAGGVGGIWPFFAGKFVELPYTLPQDHTLFVARKERDGRIWREKLRFLVRNHGMALMVTHPDYLLAEEGKAIYRDFLTYVAAQEGYWHALPREIAQWWREREEAATALRAGEALPSPRASIAELRLQGGDLHFAREAEQNRDYQVVSR